MMCILYIGGVVIILITHFNLIPQTVVLVVHSAFNPQAALGGGIGITMTMAMQKGISRGIFQMKVVLEVHQLPLLQQKLIHV